MSEFLHTLGYDPFRYWLLAWTCLGLWALASTLPYAAHGPLIKRLGSPFNHAVLLLVTMVAFRWPTFLYKPVNPDEPQFLAGALTMLARHEFWWPDAMTSGPLVMLPLTAPAVPGLPINYASGRVVALLLSWGIVLFLLLIFRHLHGERLARLLTLPLACFMILLNFWDFTAYASEWLPLFLCSAAAWLGLTAFGTDGVLQSRARLAGAGVVLGILPFSKLQALPLGAVIGLAATAMACLQSGIEPRRRAADVAALFAATVAGFCGLAGWAWSSGGLAHLRVAYIQHNLYYAGFRSVPWAESIGEFRYLTDFSWGFSSFHLGACVLLVVGLLALRRLPREAWKPVAFSLCLLGAAYYAIVAPGRAYPHYLILVTMPLALAGGLLFGHLLRLEGAGRRFRTALFALLILAGPVAQITERLLPVRPYLRLAPTAGSRQEIVGLINRLKQPGDTLAVWGWRPELYVETQLPQGTRDAHTERQMKENPQRDYFRSRYLADLEATRPAFLVDAVGRGGFLYQNRATDGLETFPGLTEFVGQHYRLAGELNSFRLYLRQDRSAAATP